MITCPSCKRPAGSNAAECLDCEEYAEWHSTPVPLDDDERDGCGVILLIVAELLVLLAALFLWGP